MLRLGLALVASFVVLERPAAGEPGSAVASTIVDRFVAASEAQKKRMGGASMEVDIEAEVPKLRKKGRLHALRKVSQLGRITFDALRFEGDRSIKNEVIARYLATDTDDRDRSDLAIIPANYKFKYKGMVEAGGRIAHAFQVSPRKKKVGLFRGDLWIDGETFLPLREAGRFVKSPSVFLKKVEFARDYDIQDGVAVPRRLESTVETRLVGKAILSVAYSAVSLAAATVDVAGETQ